MTDNIVKPPNTVLTTGKGPTKTVITGKPQLSSSTAKIVGDNQVDIVFVFDTTGSMDNKISALLETCVGFVSEAATMKLDPQYALISFGDISVRFGGDKIEVVVPLTEDIEQIKHGLKFIPRNNGFGNLGESVLEAIDEAFKIEYRDKAVKVMVVITDEPALQWATKVEKTISTLTDREFLVFVVATDEPYYHAMADSNGGIWKEIGPDTDLAEILELFKEMAKKVAKVAQQVHLLGRGSVKEFLRLSSPK